MTPEGTETLILAFISKTEISVAHNCHIIFSFGFFYQREDIFRHYVAELQISHLKGTRDITNQRGLFAFFHRFLARLNHLRFPATLIYGTTFPGSTKIHSTSPAG